ncbi:hypothetical protein SCLARK_0016 [Spiroplasma clarkii]|uniref:hypothetical protein n=1 Tax=Spiroplasma clarkii TaxID=2139 RepID=UPI000B570BB8|nr:hypothetical protein [Spiroplasma clarkii]ARU90851.1 hypothetical protein SCLARK_0016 [Spiroplasma clarkii]
MKEKLNLEVNCQIKFKKEAIKLLIVTFLIFIPSLTFIVIFYTNPNIKIYQENYQVIVDNFSSKISPSVILIESLMWVGFSLFLISFIITGFIPLLLNQQKFKKNLQNLSLILIISLKLFAIIIFTISQYNYSKFFNTYQFIAELETSNEELKSVSQSFMQSFSIGKNYNWSSNILTWWVSLIQIIFITVFWYLLLIKINPGSTHNESNEKMRTSLIKKSIGQSKFQGFLEKFSTSSLKNFAIWLIMLSAVIYYHTFFTLFLFQWVTP